MLLQNFRTFFAERAEAFFWFHTLMTEGYNDMVKLYASKPYIKLKSIVFTRLKYFKSHLCFLSSAAAENLIFVASLFLRKTRLNLLLKQLLKLTLHCSTLKRKESVIVYIQEFGIHKLKKQPELCCPTLYSTTIRHVTCKLNCFFLLITELYNSTRTIHFVSY